MNWLDVAGPPGSGKSTLCDPLWGPHVLPIEDRLPPAAWHDWLNEITRLMHLIKPHRPEKDFEAVVRMVNRSVKKIATVARMQYHTRGGVEQDNARRVPRPETEVESLPPQLPYIQTGLVQRGLGFGWRLNHMGKDLNELRHYFRLMPVSLGVAVTRCPPEIVEERNHARKLVPRTAHEDRAHMVALMQPAIEVAIEVLRDRGAAVLEVDTSGRVDEARAKLVAFAAERANAVAGHAQALGSGGEMAPVLSPPPWWQ